MEKFIKHFAAQFDDTEASELTSTTVFKELEEWSSLLALSVIAMVDEEYGAKIKGEDIRNSKTIEDLYKIVTSKN